MNGLRIALGLACPIVLPVVGVWAQDHWEPFESADNDTTALIIGAGFLLIGILTGSLIGTWWSLAYLLGLGVLVTAINLMQDEHPGSEAHAIAVMLFIVIVPITLLGATIGVLLSKGLDRGLPGSLAH